MKHEISTEIEINASVDQVWRTLLEFEDYPDWNPFLTMVNGKAEMGSMLEINAGGMAFKPEVLVVEVNSEFKWKGKLWVNGLFNGIHSFKLESTGRSTCRFVHSEKFSGLLVGMFRKKLDTETRNGFEAMNQALKERVES